MAFRFATKVLLQDLQLERDLLEANMQAACAECTARAN